MKPVARSWWKTFNPRCCGHKSNAWWNLRHACVGSRNGCLSRKNPHWVKDCPDLTDAQRKKVLDRLQEKKNKVADDTGARAVHVGQGDGDHDQMQVGLNGLLTLSLIPDSGSDWTIIPVSVIEELRTLQPSLQVGHLAEPIVASLADGTKVACLTNVMADL
ncbi:hypothetical protein V7S43_009212 [Phytophthora oleae]|uniref:Peptidase A2 domain-containing protein n=1 Tax=Phytophthora oleae TaxID=2107226 RepID=A0ABD3FG80_9STRA